MNSSEENAYSKKKQKTHKKQALLLHGWHGPQPYPSFWYQNSAYNPFSIPEAAFRNGNLYFYISIFQLCPMNIKLPHTPPPLPTTPNWSPKFPVCYNPAKFQHYRGYGEKNENQRTQTELQQEQHSGFHRIHVKVKVCSVEDSPQRKCMRKKWERKTAPSRGMFLLLPGWLSLIKSSSIMWAGGTIQS